MEPEEQAFPETFEDICSSISRQEEQLTEYEKKNLCPEVGDHLSLNSPQTQFPRTSSEANSLKGRIRDKLTEYEQRSLGPEDGNQLSLKSSQTQSPRTSSEAASTTSAPPSSSPPASSSDTKGSGQPMTKLQSEQSIITINDDESVVGGAPLIGIHPPTQPSECGGSQSEQPNHPPTQPSECGGSQSEQPNHPPTQSSECGGSQSEQIPNHPPTQPSECKGSQSESTPTHPSTQPTGDMGSQSGPVPVPDFTPFTEALQGFANIDIGMEERQAAAEIFDPLIQTLVARGSLAMPPEVAEKFQEMVKPFLWSGIPGTENVSFTKTQVSFFQKCLAIMWVQGDLFQQFYGKEDTVTKSEYFRINGFYLQAENEKRVLFQQLQSNLNVQNGILQAKEKMVLELAAVRAENVSLKQQFEAATEALKKCNTDKMSVTEVNRLLVGDGPRLGSTCGASGPAARLSSPPTKPSTPNPSTSVPSPANFPAPPTSQQPIPPAAPASVDPFQLCWPPETTSNFPPSDRHLLVNIITVYPDADFFEKVKVQNDLKIVSKVLQSRAKILKSIPATLHPILKKVDHGFNDPIPAFSALLHALAETRSTTELLEFLRRASHKEFNKKEKRPGKFFLLPFTSHTDPWARMLYSATRQRPDKEATLYLMALLAPGLYQAITRLQCLRVPPTHVDKLVTSLDPVTPHQTLLNVAVTLVSFYQLQFENNKNLGHPPIAEDPKLPQPSSGFFDCKQLQDLQKMTRFPVSIIDLHNKVQTDFAAPGAFTSARLDEAQAIQEIFQEELQEGPPSKQRRFPPHPWLHQQAPPLPLLRPFPRHRQPHYQYRPLSGPRF